MRQQKNLPLASRLYLLVPIFKWRVRWTRSEPLRGMRSTRLQSCCAFQEKCVFHSLKKGTKLLLFKFKSFYLVFGSSGGPLPLQDAADRHLDQKAAPLPGMFLCMQFCIICYIQKEQITTCSFSDAALHHSGEGLPPPSRAAGGCCRAFSWTVSKSHEGISFLYFFLLTHFASRIFFGKEIYFPVLFFITLRLPSAAIGSWTSPCSRSWSATSSFGVRSPWTACCWSPTRWWELSIILPLWTKIFHSKKYFFHLLLKCYHFYCFLTSFLSFAFVTLKKISRKSKATIYVFLFLKIR